MMNKSKYKIAIQFMRSFSMILVIILSLAAIFTLSSCNFSGDSQIRNTDDNSKKVQTPSLLLNQATNIYQSSVEIINKYYTDGIADNLVSRLNETELNVVKSERDSVISNDTPLNELLLNKTAKQYIISNSIGWPKNFLVLSSNDSEGFSTILSFVQQNVRDNYKMNAKLKVFENTELPKFKIPSDGSDQIDIYDMSFKRNILTTIEQYCDILNNGEKSTFADDFLADKFQAQIKQSHAEAGKQLAELGGSSTETFLPNVKNIYALKTYNSDAFVLAQIDSTWSRTGNDRVFATPSSPAEKSLFKAQGLGQSKSVEFGYANFIAILIPLKGSSQDIKVLAAERYPVTASAG